MVTLEFADQYFSKHLDHRYWVSLAVEEREASLSMAEGDISAALGTAVSVNNTFGKFAVCEQAVFLLRNHEKRTSGLVVTSQSLDGMSQGFTMLGTGGDVNIAPRAQSYLKRAKGYLTANVHIVRG